MGRSNGFVTGDQPMTVAQLFVSAVRCHIDDDQFVVDLIVDRLALMAQTAPTAAPAADAPSESRSAAQELSDGLLAELSARLRVIWNSGWQPVDVVKVVARLESAAVADVAMAVVTDDARHDEGKPTDPAWLAQLEDLAPWWTARHVISPPWLQRCALVLGVSERDVIERSVILLGRLLRLPPLPKLMAPPGPGAAVGAKNVGPAIDAKMLGRVRGLLAKAESTEFAEEAEALTEKAQELMTRYAIDAAMVAATSTSTIANGPEARRIHLDAPYVDAKASLVGAVATANRCRAVLAPDLGFVTVFGFATDLVVVDLLFTSLLAQATTSMVVAERILSKTSRSPTSSTRSFRQSFLISYSYRIGERLRESVISSTKLAAEDFGDALLPVLARREADVEDAVAAAFPRMKKIRSRISSEAGWTAGRVAADQASLKVGAEIRAPNSAV